MTCRSEFLLIPRPLPSQNEWVYANRTSWFKGNNMKKEAEAVVLAAIREHLHGVAFTDPVEIEYRFYERQLNRDLDNITAFAAKVIQDALVRSGVLKNDTPRYIRRMSSSVYRSKEDPHIEVMIKELI